MLNIEVVFRREPSDFSRVVLRNKRLKRAQLVDL